jgi:hypothetical protein
MDYISIPHTSSWTTAELIRHKINFILLHYMYIHVTVLSLRYAVSYCEFNREHSKDIQKLIS